MNHWALRISFLVVPAACVAVACSSGGSSTTNGSGASTAASTSSGHSSGSTSSGSTSSGSTSTGGSTSHTSSSNASSGSTSSSSGGTGGSAGTCNPTDPKNDMQPCGMGCPTGQVCFGKGICMLTCDPNDQASCPCDRYCGGLIGPDGGPAGGACFPSNVVGERCDTAFNNGPGCAQNLICARSAGSTKSYCEPLCKTQADCPAHTNCVQIVDQNNKPVAMACAYDYGPGGKAAGSTCGATDACISDYLCDGTCLAQCDGPSGMCATGTCTALVEGSATIGYVCK